MKAEREKINAKVKADTVRLNGSKLELTADEEMCTFLLVSEGSCTLQMGENDLLLNPGSALLLGAGNAVLSAAGAAVVAASVAAAVVDAVVVSLCVPFVSEPPVDAAVVDVPEEPAAVVAAAELSGATLSPGTYPSGIPSTAAADVDSTAVVSSGETFTVPVFLRITAACPL